MTLATPPRVVPDAVSVDQPKDRPPVLLMVLCIVLGAIPANVVLPGPLKGNGSPVKMIALTMAGLALLGWLLSKRTARRATLNPGAVILAAYFLVELFLYGVGVSRLGTPLMEANRGRIPLVEVAYAGAALYTVTRVTTAKSRTILLGCLAIGLTINSAIGVLSIVAGINLRFFLQPPGFMLLDAVTATGASLEPDLAVRFGALRALGTSGHAIEFSVLSAIAIPLTLHFARFAEKRVIRILASLAAITAAGGVVVGVSRSGLVALAAALLLYVWTLNVRQFMQGLLAFALAVGAAAVLLPNSAQALVKTVTNSSEDSSVLVRVAAYAKVSEIFHQYPLFGLGPGSTSNAETGHFDNQWLQVIASGGIVGLLNMIFLCLGAILGIAAALRSATNVRQRDQAFTMGAMMLGMLASTSTYDMFGFVQVTYVFFILIALLWSTFRVTVPADPLAVPHPPDASPDSDRALATTHP